jgi:ABC-type Fe3+/spermidine/putrescine transport system ATPase subunit
LAARVTFGVEKGAILTLLGPSECGKTTRRATSA